MDRDNEQTREANAAVSAHVGLKAQLSSKAASIAEPGLLTFMSEIDSPSGSGAYIHGAPELARVETMLAALSAHGRPFQVSVRSRHQQLYDSVLANAGLSIVADLPFMSVQPRMFCPMPRPDELDLRILDSDDARHLPLVAQGLGMALDALEPAMSAANRASPGWTGYAGEVDGNLAVTGTAIASRDGAGLISIVTDPAYARRGFAGALTSIAVADAFARGVPRVFLHASAQGLALYERLGFQVLESLVVFGREDS